MKVKIDPFVNNSAILGGNEDISITELKKNLLLN